MYQIISNCIEWHYLSVIIGRYQAIALNLPTIYCVLKRNLLQISNNKNTAHRRFFDFGPTTWYDWGDESQVEYTSDDPRFSFEGAKAVVFDIPTKEAKLHNDIVKSPGVVPSKYLVGVINTQPSNTVINTGI